MNLKELIIAIQKLEVPQDAKICVESCDDVIVWHLLYLVEENVLYICDDAGDLLADLTEYRDGKMPIYRKYTKGGAIESVRYDDELKGEL